MVHPQTFWIEIYTNSHPRRGKTASRKLTINNEKLSLHVGIHRKHAVPEGGELCLTACVVTEGNGTCGKPKPPRPSPKGGEQQAAIRPLRGRCYQLHIYRKFRFAPHAVKHSWTSSTPLCALVSSNRFADEPILKTHPHANSFYLLTSHLPQRLFTVFLF
mgnify:CR=1 FL=1